MSIVEESSQAKVSSLHAADDLDAIAETPTHTDEPAGPDAPTGARPWQSSATWILFQVLVVWTIVCIVLLTLPLEAQGSDAKANAWIWAAIAIPWCLFMTRCAMLRALRSPSTEVTWQVDYELWRQCFVMAHFALERGRTPGSDDLDVVQRYDRSTSTTDWRLMDEHRVEELTATHKRLSKLVAPALPKTILLLSDLPDNAAPSERPQRHPDAFAWLGNVRVARMMLGIAVGLLPVFIALALAKGTSLDSSGQLFQGGFLDKVGTASYLIVASALGAAFAALFKVRKYVENLNYDDQYESSYWVRFVLGLVAGLVLAVLVSSMIPNSDDQQFRVTVPLLALVGGFSSDLVYRILKRLIDSVETLIEGSASEINEAERQKTEARLREQEAAIEQRLNDKLLERRHQEIAALVGLLDQLPQDATDARASVAERMAAIVRDLSSNGHSAPLQPATEQPAG